MAEIPKRMRAARVADFNKPYSIEEVDVPVELGPHDVLVKMRAAGYCHTDLQVLQGVYESAGAKPGLIGSHEPAGEVVKLGSQVGSGGEGRVALKVGDRVGSINTYGFCDSCSSCRQGKQVCDNLSGMLGLTIDGGFAQYMKADARVVSKIPESIPWEEAAPLFCAGATIYGALLAANPQPGQWVAIIGIGGLGHLGVQYAKAMGLKVIAIDNRAEGVALARDVPEHLRPDKTYVVDSDEASDKVAAELSSPGTCHQTNPGVDRVVIATESPDLPRWSQQFLRKGGQLCEVGLPSDASLAVDPYALSFKEQTIRGRLICTPEQCQDMVQMHADNGCRVYIEKTYPVDGINDMLERYQSKELKGRLCMVF